MSELAIPLVRWRITAALFAAQALYSAASIASFTVTSIIGAELGGSPEFAGLPAAMLYVGRATSPYPVGVIMDRIGRRPGIAAGYLAGTIGAAVAVFAILAGSYLFFVMATFIYGMARGGADQSRFVAAEVHPEDRRGRIIGLIVFSGTIGAISGPTLVSLSEHFTLNLGVDWLVGPWIIASALSLVSMAVILTLVRPDPLELLGRASTTYSRGQRNSSTENTRTFGNMMRDSRVRLAVSSMIVGQVVMAMIMTMTPLHMNSMGQGTLPISLAMTGHTMGMFGLAWVTGWLVDRFGQVPMIMVGAVVLMTTGLLAGLAEGLVAIVLVMFLLGLGWNFASVAGATLLIASIETGARGRTQGVAEALTSMTAATAGLGSGFVFAWGGLELLGWTGLALAAVLMVGTFWTSASPRRTSPRDTLL